MTNYVIPFRYNEATNDNICVIMDYLNEQPGRLPATKSDAIRYALAIAAIHIANEQAIDEPTD